MSPEATPNAPTGAVSGREVAARIGRVGVWSPQLQWQPAARAQEAVAEMEELGFGAVWIGEATGKEVMTHAALLLAGGRRIAVGTGIASIWARDPLAMANAGRTLEEAYPGRFVMGLGVSHPFLNEPRDRAYQRPYTAMVDYLDLMDQAPWVGPPAAVPPRVLAALGPRMLALARDRAAGAHPYFVTVEHTEGAREILGPEPVLAPEQGVLFAADRESARRAVGRYLTTYLSLANYASNLRRLGWETEDLAGEGSDRLMDAIVAWGDLNAIVARIRAHLEAGADHVAVRVLGIDPVDLPLAQLRALSEALDTLG